MSIKEYLKNLFALSKWRLKLKKMASDADYYSRVQRGHVGKKLSSALRKVRERVKAKKWEIDQLSPRDWPDKKAEIKNVEKNLKKKIKEVKKSN